MIKYVDFDLLTIIIFFTIYVPIFCILRWKMKKSNSYLIISTILYIYLCGVLSYTQFPILISNNIDYDVMKNVNYIPILTLSASDIKTSLLNVVLTIPFGFLVSILKKQSAKTIAGYGVLFGIIVEGIQFIVGRFIGFNMRVIDINDIIFNFIGVYIGFISYRICRNIFVKIMKVYSIESNEFFECCLFNKDK